MAERNPLPAAYIAKIHSAASRALSSAVRRREWPHGEFSSPVVMMSLCAEIARLNIELERCKSQEAANA